MKTILSVNKVPIRLTEERWLHITEGHSEMAGYYYDAIETSLHLMLFMPASPVSVLH